MNLNDRTAEGGNLMTYEISQAIRNRASERPFFDQSTMGAASNQYVCWLDVMGSQSSMLRSTRIAANFVMKLHVAALETQATLREVSLFPIIDGIYACSPRQGDILQFVKSVMCRLALCFVMETDNLHKFMVRGALAFGPVVKGNSAAQGSTILTGQPNYCSQIIMGMPLIQAYTDERKASPFGLYIHESARAFAPVRSNPITATHWHWWKWSGDESELAATTLAALNDYYTWADKQATTILYDSERQRHHKSLFTEYFSELERSGQ